MKRPLIIANWKAYIESKDESKRWLQSVARRAKGADVWAAVPAPFIAKNSAIKIGAQTVSPHAAGAHTGEVTAAMLKNAGASFVLVGHSERRAGGETNEIVRAQLAAAVNAALTAVLCVGESARHDDGSHFSVIAEQLTAALAGAAPFAAKILIAYEPVWAIGKSAGAAMAPQALEETVIFIRKTLADIVGRDKAVKVPILYGGSVEGSNADVLLEQGGVAGFLVGHASAKVDTFMEIVNALR